jgi:uncharacterized protein YPO0396
VVVMVEMKKTILIDIRTEYETTNISQPELSEKYNISYSTIKARAKKEVWKKSRKETQHKIAKKIRQKAIEKVVDLNTKHFDLWDLLFDRIKENIRKEMLSIMNPLTGDSVEVDREAKDLAEIAKAIEKLQKGQRLAKNILTEYEQRKLDIDAEKLELEKQKLKIDSEEKPIEIVIKRKVRE